MLKAESKADIRQRGAETKGHTSTMLATISISFHFHSGFSID